MGFFIILYIYKQKITVFIKIVKNILKNKIITISENGQYAPAQHGIVIFCIFKLVVLTRLKAKWLPSIVDHFTSSGVRNYTQSK